MAVTTISRWKANREDVVRLGGQMANVMKGFGASDFQVHQIYAGENTGQWIVALQFPDWSTYGNAMEKAVGSPEYQKLMAEATKIGELLSRGILVSAEI